MSEKKNQIVEPICNIVFFKIKGKIYLAGELWNCQYHIIPKKVDCMRSRTATMGETLITQ